MTDRFDVAVVGATGVVGESMLEILAERRFPVGKIFALASERSAGKRVEAKPFEFAKPLAPVTNTGIWDRIGLWTIVAVVLIAIAYAYPLFHMLAMPRFGSPGFMPY